MYWIFSDFEAYLLYFIFIGFQLHPDYYSCPEDIQLRPVGMRRQYWGIYFVVSGVFILILYTICFCAIATSDLIKTPAYKTMFVLGIFDIFSTFMHSVATGILGYYGIAFCDYPRLIYVVGSFGLGTWMGCCMTSMVLAVIRICDVCPTLKIRKLYQGSRIYVFICFFWIYGMYGAFLSKPVLFSSVYMSWFFDPGVGKDILLQAFFFCIFHLISSVLYVYMQFVSTPE